MPDISTITLPPPSSWDEFEEICADLFGVVWHDIHTDRYGKSGQRQNGVDIFGKPNGVKSGVQCKGKQIWPPKKLTVADINSEVANALKFKPKLNELIFATTASSDVVATDRANMITEAQEAEGLFSVHVWSWDKISRELKKHPQLISKHYGFISNEEVKNDIRSIAEKVAEAAKSNALPADFADIEIQKILKPILRYRYLQGFDHNNRITCLLDELQSGTLRDGSAEVKSNALGWCARLLSKTDLPSAKIALDDAQQLGSGDAITIAEAFIVAENNDLKKALGLLNKLATPAARSAALTLIDTASDDVNDHTAAFEWIGKSQLKYTDFDSHGQILILIWQMGAKGLEDTLTDANTLTEVSFEAAPVLRNVCAMANLKSIIPEEFRNQVTTVPFELRDFPLSMTDDALSLMRLAQRHFERFSEQVFNDGFPQFSIVAEEFALWLKIRDPNTREQGIEDLKVRYSRADDQLRYLKFAIDFRIPNIDIEAISLEIDRQMSLSGNSSSDAAIARFYLAFAQKTPADVADYIDRYREEFIDYVPAISLAHLEIEMLARAGRIPQAQSVLHNIDADELNESGRIKLERVIEEGKGSNAVALRIAEFEETDSLSSLMNLLDELKEKDDQSQIVKYAKIFFERVPDESNLSRLVSALHETGERETALDLIEQNDNFVSRSLYLKKMKSLLLYELGHVVDAQKEITALASEVNDLDIRDIEIRIAITSGDWERLNVFVEQDWPNRDKLSVQQLMQAASLAKSINSTRLLQFLVEATSRDNPTAELMISAHQLVVSANLEDEAQKHNWLASAIELSGDDGPVRRFSLPEIKTINPDWEERQSANWDAVKRAERPMYLAAHVTNISLCERMLIPALGNLNESDPRRRALIYTQTGVPKSVSGQLKCIMLEPTALITVMLLDIYDDLLQAFDSIFIPHTTLGWLLEERQRVRFHQPSQIENARKTRDLFEIPNIKHFKPNRAFNNDLAFEVGRSLADMIVEASTVDEPDPKGKYVVRSSPVHRVTNLLSEDVDLSAYSSILISCAGLVEALKIGGYLAEEIATKALAYLSGHEKRWPNEPSISPDSKLYLDGLSVTYLLPFGILETAAQAGYEIYIEDEETRLVSQLLKYSGISEKAGGLIEKFRSKLADGIRDSRIKLAPIPARKEQKGEDFQITQHPSIGILEVPSVVDAIISDDRYFNKFGHVDTDKADVPILATSDLFNSLVSKKIMSNRAAWTHRIKMRQAGFMLMDLDIDELLNFIKKAKTQNGVLVETAELRAIRENWQMAKMFKAAILPNDAPWLHKTLKNIEAVLKAQWNEDIPDEEARAKSGWLLALRDMTGWTSAFETDTSAQLPEFMLEIQILTLLAPSQDISDASKERYWQWIESAILGDLRINEPVTFNKIITMVSDGLINSANRFPGDAE